MAAAHETAHELREWVRTLLQQERGAWVPLSTALWGIHHHEAWRELSAESFSTWLAEEDIGRNRGYLLVSIWECFGDYSDELEGLDPQKFTLLVGPVKRGELTAEDALADIRALSRSDLREKYAHAHEEDQEEHERCITCGQELP